MLDGLQICLFSFIVEAGLGLDSAVHLEEVGQVIGQEFGGFDQSMRLPVVVEGLVKLLESFFCDSAEPQVVKQTPPVLISILPGNFLPPQELQLFQDGQGLLVAALVEERNGVRGNFGPGLGRLFRPRVLKNKRGDQEKNGPVKDDEDVPHAGSGS